MKSLEQVIATALSIPADQVTDKLAFNTVQEWDSLGHINLMMALEQAYHCRIDEDRIIELTDVALIRRFLSSQGPPASAPLSTSLPSAPLSTSLPTAALSSPMDQGGAARAVSP